MLNCKLVVESCPRVLRATSRQLRAGVENLPDKTLNGLSQCQTRCDSLEIQTTRLSGRDGYLQLSAWKAHYRVELCTSSD